MNWEDSRYINKHIKQTAHSSNIVGTNLGKADFNCVRVTRPTIWPNASTVDMRTYRNKTIYIVDRALAFLLNFGRDSQFKYKTETLRSREVAQTLNRSSNAEFRKDLRQNGSAQTKATLCRKWCTKYAEYRKGYTQALHDITINGCRQREIDAILATGLTPRLECWKEDKKSLDVSWLCCKVFVGLWIS